MFNWLKGKKKAKKNKKPASAKVSKTNSTKTQNKSSPQSEQSKSLQPAKMPLKNRNQLLEQVRLIVKKEPKLTTQLIMAWLKQQD